MPVADAEAATHAAADAEAATQAAPGAAAAASEDVSLTAFVSDSESEDSERASAESAESISDEPDEELWAAVAEVHAWLNRHPRRWRYFNMLRDPYYDGAL